MTNTNNISIAVYDDILQNIETGNIEKVAIIRKNVVKKLQNNPNDRLVQDLLFICREKMNNKKPVKKSFLERLAG